MKNSEFYKAINAETIDRFAHTNAGLIKGAVKGVVTRFHGYGGCNTSLPIDSLDEYFAEHGILSFYPFYGPWAWASDACLAMIDRIIDILCEIHGLDGNTPLVIHGQSMGGMTSLLYTRHAAVYGNPLKLVGCAADCPVCDLDVLWKTRQDIFSSLVAAYGHYDCSFDEAVRRTNPLALVCDMPDIPYYIVQGELDGEFDPLEQSGVFVPELKKYAADVYYEFVPGMAHCSMTQEIASRYFDFIVRTIERNS